MAFKDKTQEAHYVMCRKFGADKSSSFYIEGNPRRGASHRAAYWNGRSGNKSRYARNSIAYACWAAGRDDLHEHGRVPYSEYGSLQAERNAAFLAERRK